MEQVVFYGAEHHPSVHERNRLAHIIDIKHPLKQRIVVVLRRRVLWRVHVRKSYAPSSRMRPESEASQLVHNIHPTDSVDRGFHKKCSSGVKYSIERVHRVKQCPREMSREFPV